MDHDASSSPRSDPFVIRSDGQEWRAEPDLNRLTTNAGTSTQLEPRVMRLLQVLAQRAGSVVSREALLEAVWKEKVVNEEVLTRAISSLRNAFGDSPQFPKIIDTVHGTGYRFIAEVAPVKEETEVASPFAEGSALDLRGLRQMLGSRTRVYVGLAAGVVLLLIGVAASLSMGDPPPPGLNTANG
jgi:DNA-binding winged helix-turn-helix (wHTH) protein